MIGRDCRQRHCAEIHPITGKRSNLNGKGRLITAVTLRENSCATRAADPTAPVIRDATYFPSGGNAVRPARSLDIPAFLSRAGRSASFQVPTAALRAYKLPLLGHLNEDHVVPELQFQERLHRLMLASERMHSERSFATRSGVANGLCGLAARHSRRIAAGLSQFLIRGGKDGQKAFRRIWF